MGKYLLLLVFLFCNQAFAQTGKLLLIGGGSEKSTENAWNSQAYKWAVDNSENKRVAIISYGTADSWLPDYFKNNCGAQNAKISISTHRQ